MYKRGKKEDADSEAQKAASVSHSADRLAAPARRKGALNSVWVLTLSLVILCVAMCASVNGQALQVESGINLTPSAQTANEISPAGGDLSVSPSAGTHAGRTEPNSLASRPAETPLTSLPSMARAGVDVDKTLPLTLNEAVRLALENNNDIDVARQVVGLAESSLRSLQGVYEPVFRATPEFRSSTSPQESSLGGSDKSGSVVQTDFQLNQSIVKRFSRGGGQYEFFLNNNRRTTNAIYNQLNPVYSSALGVTFTQPLLRDRSIDSTRRLIQIQRKRLEQSDADFRRETIEVIADVQSAYWELVFALRNQQHRIANLNLARENLRRVEASILSGAHAPLERTEVETELYNRQAEALLASQNVSVAENNLKQLLLRDSSDPQWSAQVLPIDEPTFDTEPVNLKAALEAAHENRAELNRLRVDEQINDIDLRFFQNQTRPRVDLQASFSTIGLAGSPVSGVSASGTQLNTQSTPQNLVGGYGQMLRNMFGFGARSVAIGVTIEFPLRNKTAEADLAGARIERARIDASVRSVKQSIDVQVRNAVQAVETTRQRVLTARSARQSAEAQLEAERKLYQVGRSTMFLLFQRENQFTATRNLELRAQVDYNKAMVSLQRATSTTLSAYNVVIQARNTAP
ncbi:MAG TPA: TolC family protein [Pyrinomonadaceae bacterium]